MDGTTFSHLGFLQHQTNRGNTMSTEIYLVYITLSTGEEIRTDILNTWKAARKIMQFYKRKGIASRAQLINTASEETENRSICAPVYFTL
jgi:hypothetical protein